MTKRTLYLPMMIAAAVALACAVALSALSQKKAEAAFPGHNGRIAYLFGSYPEDNEIYSMKPDGTNRKQLTDNSVDDRAPDISPDGKRIAFETQSDVWVMDADGSNRKNLTDTGPVDGASILESGPSWSPDGKRIAFEKNEDVWVMDADGSNRKNLTDTGPVNGYEVREGDPAYSPDGTKIAFYKESFRPHDVDLYTLTIEGTKLRQVTDLPGKEFAPDWSPNGHRLVYRGATRSSERIFTIRPDGTSKRLIASDGQGPVFSPDGKRIAFTRNGDLYKVTSDGAGEPSAADGPAESWELAPDWGPKPTTTRR